MLSSKKTCIIVAGQQFNGLPMYASKIFDVIDLFLPQFVSELKHYVLIAFGRIYFSMRWSEFGNVPILGCWFKFKGDLL